MPEINWLIDWLIDWLINPLLDLQMPATIRNPCMSSSFGCLAVGGWVVKSPKSREAKSALNVTASILWLRRARLLSKYLLLKYCWNRLLSLFIIGCELWFSWHREGLTWICYVTCVCMCQCLVNRRTMTLTYCNWSPVTRPATLRPRARQRVAVATTAPCWTTPPANVLCRQHRTPRGLLVRTCYSSHYWRLAPQNNNNNNNKTYPCTCKQAERSEEVDERSRTPWKVSCSS